jgi:hypothetical protein
MIYRALNKGEYILFKVEERPIGFIRAQRKLDTIYLMGQYQNDLDKVMDNYDLETFVKGFVRWLIHIRKSADEIDLNEKVDMNMVQ